MKKEEKEKRYAELANVFANSGIQPGMILCRNDICKLLFVEIPKGSSMRDRANKEFSCLFDWDEEFWKNEKKFKIIKIYDNKTIMDNFNELLKSSGTGKHSNHNVEHNNDKYLSATIEIFRRHLWENCVKVFVASTTVPNRIEPAPIEFTTTTIELFYKLGILKHESKDFYKNEFLEFFKMKVDGAKFWEKTKNELYINIMAWDGIVDKKILEEINRVFLFPKLFQIFRGLVDKLEKNGIITNHIKDLKFSKENCVDYVPSEVLKEIEEKKSYIKNTREIYEAVAYKHEWDYIYTKHFMVIDINKLNALETSFEPSSYSQINDKIIINIISSITEKIDKMGSDNYFAKVIIGREKNVKEVKKSCEKLSVEYKNYLEEIFKFAS